MIRTQIQLTEAQSARIRQAAAESRVSMAEFIRKAVDKALSQSVMAGQDERRDRAVQAAGRFHSGGRDGASRHDAHLAEAYKG